MNLWISCIFLWYLSACCFWWETAKWICTAMLIRSTLHPSCTWQLHFVFWWNVGRESWHLVLPQEFRGICEEDPDKAGETLKTWWAELSRNRVKVSTLKNKWNIVKLSYLFQWWGGQFQICCREVGRAWEWSTLAALCLNFSCFVTHWLTGGMRGSLRCTACRWN